jgi:hypothetical protein
MARSSRKLTMKVEGKMEVFFTQRVKGENDMIKSIVNLFYLLFTMVKVGFFLFIHYLTLIAYVEVSKMTCRYPMRMIIDKNFCSVV